MLWDKGTRPADWVTRFTVGEDARWDTILLPYDLAGTRAHAWGLVQIGLLTADEYAAIEDALDDLHTLHAEGQLIVTPADEDMHTVIEQRLTERLGDVGKKIHTGRSRNDQVLTALRLYLRDALRQAGRQTADLVEALCVHGERYDQALMPGYTHYQRAMPTTAGQWALGYAEVLLSDLAALEAADRQINVSPLGSAAGYGVPFLALPRAETAARLGYASVQTHVTTVQLSRGKTELHVLHALVQVGATLNRLASDLVLMNSAEFGFVQLPAAYCTGSSIMPQKQNPDVLELARATYHRLLAEMQVLTTLPANLPSGYHRDLQLTKEAVMRGVLTAHDLLEALQRVVPDLSFDEEAMAAACTPELFATAEALRRVQQGTPFREAYREAAAALADLDAPTPAEALAAYRVPGYPGQGQPEALRAHLVAAQGWCTGS
ncbi:MAG: argininosuccinate lyase [Bacteroidota bacterium]